MQYPLSKPRVKWHHFKSVGRRAIAVEQERVVIHANAGLSPIRLAHQMSPSEAPKNHAQDMRLKVRSTSLESLRKVSSKIVLPYLSGYRLHPCVSDHSTEAKLQRADLARIDPKAIFAFANVVRARAEYSPTTWSWKVMGQVQIGIPGHSDQAGANASASR